MFDHFVRFVRDLYGTKDFIPLHEPRFNGNERRYVLDTIDSTFVSSVGSYVDEFELRQAEFTGATYAVATVNGTAALHVALLLAGVKAEDEVLTQSLTFVASCNAIRYCGAEPVFIDVDRNNLGLSPNSLRQFLEENCEVRDDGVCWNRVSNKPVRACLPMHTFGFPAALDGLVALCEEYNIVLVEDAAESLGSFYNTKHTGTMGKLGAISFNGNKIMTSGGGGMLLTNDEDLAVHAKHMTTTAKISHHWEFDHDELGFNYRLPNINAALGVAQMESLPSFVESKRHLAQQYQAWGERYGLRFIKEPQGTKSNYWLNAVLAESRVQRDAMLEFTNERDVMTRPAWKPMHHLQMNSRCQSVELTNTEWLYARIVNVPSSVPIYGE